MIGVGGQSVGEGQEGDGPSDVLSGAKGRESVLDCEIDVSAERECSSAPSSAVNNAEPQPPALSFFRISLFLFLFFSFSSTHKLHEQPLGPPFGFRVQKNPLLFFLTRPSCRSSSPFLFAGRLSGARAAAQHLSARLRIDSG